MSGRKINTIFFFLRKFTRSHHDQSISKSKNNDICVFDVREYAPSYFCSFDLKRLGGGATEFSLCACERERVRNSCKLCNCLWGTETTGTENRGQDLFSAEDQHAFHVAVFSSWDVNRPDNDHEACFDTDGVMFLSFSAFFGSKSWLMSSSCRYLCAGISFEHNQAAKLPSLSLSLILSNSLSRWKWQGTSCVTHRFDQRWSSLI